MAGHIECNLRAPYQLRRTVFIHDKCSAIINIPFKVYISVTKLRQILSYQRLKGSRSFEDPAHRMSLLLQIHA